MPRIANPVSPVRLRAAPPREIRVIALGWLFKKFVVELFRVCYNKLILNFIGLIAGIAQLVERNLAKVEVVGSRPISRSKFTCQKFSIFDLKGPFGPFFFCQYAQWFLGFYGD